MCHIIMAPNWHVPFQGLRMTCEQMEHRIKSIKEMHGVCQKNEWSVDFNATWEWWSAEHFLAQRILQLTTYFQCQFNGTSCIRPSVRPVVVTMWQRNWNGYCVVLSPAKDWVSLLRKSSLCFKQSLARDNWLLGGMLNWNHLLVSPPFTILSIFPVVSTVSS